MNIIINVDEQNPFVSPTIKEYCLKAFKFNTIEEYELWMDDAEEIDYLGEILAIEYSIFLLRRTSGDCCGSNTDNMVGLRRKFINQYNETFEKKFIEYNKDLYY